ncbi:hypothetical protein POPTR_002G041000v4 [Populus trichocarpa]|uniref:Uncharacterized protein n=2 Tax=Populus trichocarpa TaxID=3694 RepID=A0ACC0TBY1_POPTR|nr:uncharacterized protein LOC7471981 [Populus trichocarpa]KAI5596992.1 hypothetical protein BDE02_02G038600 [Populus trichocarpa]KAI5596994.1 hypothetical protein BDE02_02G038600 [Populus trichocarpa]KAI9399050.1 hypothetical protein POPTR_002G041000v4 [Populus trichocarpa]KAI9399051.1 hypothetical protein POPTR_002G041000v4 [Populus trichocarpa]
MLRKKSIKELGFIPDIVTDVGYATLPCVSRELAESCSHFVTTIVMQDDIIHRLSAASLARLRNEILQTDWMSVVEKEDWKSVIGLVTNAKQVISSVQDAAQKLVDYARFGSKKILLVTPSCCVLIPDGWKMFYFLNDICCIFRLAIKRPDTRQA